MAEIGFGERVQLAAQVIGGAVGGEYLDTFQSRLLVPISYTPLTLPTILPV
ncbi:MAG: hypothetical protein K2I74_07635 [Treponemataceae bacterium]|nr:hypothetical protein [Treponemataceae bacterium]